MSSKAEAPANSERTAMTHTAIKQAQTQTVQEPVAQWQLRHHLHTDGIWENCTESEAAVMQKQAHFEIRPLYTTPPAAPVQGWMNPNDKTQRKFLPDIGDKVLFCNGGRVYYGHHTGGGFRTGQGVATKYFGTWDCHWMPIPPAHGITKGQR
jgi:hypothetical protein